MNEKNVIGRKIADKLIEIHGSADFKIAFLPYKRSMWNSMESVYEECKASGAEVHCMPIPFYRMKAYREYDYIDNDFDLFGDIAEKIDDLEAIHPDFIVIHYQYEDYNMVTNMLPEYFTINLKTKYKCKIVYIPYGIGGGDLNRHLILQPGLCLIDYAFLESEENVSQFHEEWQKIGLDFSGRIFGYGSPKLDAGRKIHKDIPKEWESIIGNKEVTLIVNSLGAFLGEPEKRIEQYFNKASIELAKDRTVIFRPHPLLRTTIKAMTPKVEGLYNKMLQEMKYLKRIIIDESEDLERAMNAADYLISDPSSIVPVWEMSGKEYEIL